MECGKENSTTVDDQGDVVATMDPLKDDRVSNNGGATVESDTNQLIEQETQNKSLQEMPACDYDDTNGKAEVEEVIVEASEEVLIDPKVAEIDSSSKTEHSIPIIDENLETSNAECLTSRNVLDDKTLSENISSKTVELMDSMATDNNNSTMPSAATIPPPNTNQPKTKENPTATATGLGLLAQYNSDSDADCEVDNEVEEVPIEVNKNYRSKVVEIDSDSDSESTSSDESGVEYLSTIRKEIQKTINLEDDDDDDDDDDDENSRKQKKKPSMRVKGELLLEDLPPIQDLHITVPEEECIELGRVHSVVDQLLLVTVLPGSLLLDLETILFLDKGKRVLGEVFDVLGQVADPMYCVRFNSHEEIEGKGIKIGDIVYVAPKTEYTQFVILSNMMKLRGSDASWENDVEPPPRYLDYSDDEQEREARARLRNRDRPNDHEEPFKRARNNSDSNESSPCSSTTTANSRNRASQRSGRFNQSQSDSMRSPYQYQCNQAMPSAYHRGSWHSNYQQPYVQRGPPMPVPFQFYPPAQYSRPPHMPPMTSPRPPPMYVMNPLSVPPPNMLNNGPRYQAPQPSRPMESHSPPPAPPGLE